MGFPAIPLPVPVTGLHSLMVGDFKVALGHCETD